MKVRVWMYRDGTLVPHGFQSEVAAPGSTGGEVAPWTSKEGERATVESLIRMVESMGDIEVCIGTDEPDESNAEVVEWVEA